MGRRERETRPAEESPRGARGRAAVVLACAVFALVTVTVVTLFVVGYCMLLDARSGGRNTPQPTAAAAAAAAADSSYDAAAGAIDTAVYDGTVLPPTEDAGRAYVDGTLFIGDSNTYRYMNYGYNTLENNIGIVGMSTPLIASEPCVRFAGYGGYVTIPQAVALMQPQRVLVGFGTNDLTGDVAWFVSAYTKAIQAIYNAYPYFEVIVCAVPPVAKQRSYTNVTMQQVDAFNAALVEMCRENGWKFLNSSEALKDPDTGFCREGYTVSDGLHLSSEGCGALFEYFRTHADQAEDRRPQPLAAVPVHEETPVDLIVKDPLKEEEDEADAVIDVTFIAGEGGALSGETEQSVQAGGVCTEVTAEPKEGYVFAGWSCNVGRIDAPEKAALAFAVPDEVDAYGGIFVTASFEKQADGEAEDPDAAAEDAGAEPDAGQDAVPGPEGDAEEAKGTDGTADPEDGAETAKDPNSAAGPEDGQPEAEPETERAPSGGTGQKPESAAASGGSAETGQEPAPGGASDAGTEG